MTLIRSPVFVTELEIKMKDDEKFFYLVIWNVYHELFEDIDM